MGDAEVNYRTVGRRSFLALAGLGLLSLVEGCSKAYEVPALQLGPEPPVPHYTTADFRPRPAIIKGFTVYNTGPTGIDLESWRLRVDGLVSRTLEYTIQDILAFQPVVFTKSLVCGSGWAVKNVRWQGIRTRTLLDAAGVAPEAKSVNLYSMDGKYGSSLSLDSVRAEDVLLAYGANNEPLAREQGYPLRLVVPRMFGYQSIKWINRIELSADEHHDLFENQGNDLLLWTR
jgi:DMSO/TMAO reductase YedYZ molybdopterin-dependent catalytic subunit